MSKHKPVILVVDDEPLVRETLCRLLETADYTVVPSENAESALLELKKLEANVVLSDLQMPKLSGIDLLKEVRRLNLDIPVILLTGHAELGAATEAVRNGAFDFILKPLDFDYLLVTVAKAVKHYRLVWLEKNYNTELEDTVKRKTAELTQAMATIKRSSREMMDRLLVATEYRDDATGEHVQRIGMYSAILAGILDMDDDFKESIAVASSLHDVGKIGIPDSILLKKGPLLPEEFEVVKTHTLIGSKILSGSSVPLLEMARRIALGHHERWDGTGYPHGLAKEAIPMECRIVMICDQYDAMRCKRSYKDPYDHQRTFKILTVGDGRTQPGHFDPRVLEAFKQTGGIFDKIFNKTFNFDRAVIL
jgi:putative two-component system response regulator